MFGTDKKRWTLLLAVILLLCCSLSAYAQQDIINVSRLSDDQISYRTTQPQIGTLEKTVNVMGKVCYPLSVHVRFEGKKAKLAEYAVSVGDSVKAGDVLLYYTVESSSEVALTRMELNLSRTKEAFEQGIRSRQDEIARIRAEISAEKDKYEKEKKTLDMRILEIELEKYRYEQERNILSQHEALEAAKAQQTQNVVLAPVDGVVDALSNKAAEDALSDGEVLVTLHLQEVMLIEVDNTAGSFRYNMPVSVSIGSGAQAVQLTGRVAASENDVRTDHRTNKAYIQLDPYEVQIRQMRNIKVSARTLYVPGVLLVSEDALSIEQGRKFVNCLHGSAVHKRYVQQVMDSGFYTWILSGVSKDDTLVLN